MVFCEVGSGVLKTYVTEKTSVCSGVRSIEPKSVKLDTYRV
jgi:hypothetical protein